jgi:O-antigen/teichoic acid export membrane protein
MQQIMHKFIRGFVNGWLDFRQKLLNGVFWNLISTVSLQGSMLVTGALVARIIGLENFGVYALMIGTLMSLTGIAQGSSGVVVNKFVAESISKNPQRVARVIKMCAVATSVSGLFFGTILWALAPIIANDLLQKPMMTLYLRFVAFAVFFQVLIAYQNGALQGLGAYKRLGFANSMAGLVHLVASVLGALIDGLEGAVIGLVVSALARALIANLSLRKTLAEHGIKRSTKIKTEELRKVWSFALPSTLAGFVTLPCIWAVTLLVTRQPEGLAWIALFSVAHQIKQAVIQLPAMLNVVAFTALSWARGKDDYKSYRIILKSSIIVSFVFVTLVAVIVSVIAQDVLWLFGSDFVAGEELLRILLIAAVVETLASSAYQIVQSRGLMWHSLFIIVFPRDLGYLFIAALGLATWGLSGSGIAYLIAHIAGLILTIIVIYITKKQTGSILQ